MSTNVIKTLVGWAVIYNLEINHISAIEFDNPIYEDKSEIVT